MKNLHTTFLKLTTVLASIPILFLCLYYFPKTLISGISSESEYMPYLLILMISIYLIGFPYIIALIETIKVLVLIDKKQFYTEQATSSIDKISKMSYAVSGILFIDLPFVYIIAQIDDAPGLILIVMFLAMLALSIAVFASMIYRLLTEKVNIDTKGELK